MSHSFDGSELIEAAGRRLLERCAALGRFSGVALLARDGEVLFAAALGLAEREPARALAVDTRFALGSITKPFTAAAVLQLETEGALALSDPIGLHLGDLELPFAGAVTVEHLLLHRSGIPSLFKPHLGIELSDGRAARPASRAELCHVFSRLPLRFAPGTRTEYSNSGYALLALIAERASGQPWDDCLRERVLAPAGLTRTSSAPAPGDAAGYLGGQRTRPAHASWLVGSGDLIAPAGDLAAWDSSAVARALRARGQHGLLASVRRGRRVLHHDGALAGFVNTYHSLPEYGMAVVVLTNSTPGWPHVPLATRLVNRIADQLADLALGQPPDQDGVPPLLAAGASAELDRCTGRYQLASGLELEVRREGRSLWAETRGARPWTLWGLDALAGLDDTPRGRVAAALLAALAEGRGADALALFAPDHARALSPGRLADLWQALCRRVGAAPAFRLFQVHADVAYLRAGTPPLDAVVAFDEADRVVGFHVIESGVGPASRTVELCARADDAARFWADGYRLAAPDVELSFEPAGARAEAVVIHLGAGHRGVRQAD